jgi:hypothetical protein
MKKIDSTAISNLEDLLDLAQEDRGGGSAPLSERRGQTGQVPEQ